MLPALPAVFYLLGYSRTVFVYLGLAIQTAYVFSRGMQLGRLPIIGPHDTLYFLSFSVVLFALPITFRMTNRGRHLFPMLGLSTAFIFLSLFFPEHSSPLPPVLKTFWFESHVALSFFSYALFGIAAVLGMTFLFFGGGDKGVPDEAEVLQYKAILLGYCFFSAAMVFGGIWAYFAWGTYWLWTPKELWTVILWLFYSLYLHARLRQWWSGRPSAILGIVGFGIVMFTYLGVSLLMKSSHAF